MSVQDDARENRMLDLFNLFQPPDRVRHGTDAVLHFGGRVLEFELKSVTTAKGGLTTVRDFGPDHIAKWKNKHWLISVYRQGTLLYCQYGSPAAMAPWIEEKWNYIRTDFSLTQHVPQLLDINILHQILGVKPVYTIADARRLHKNQYSKAEYLALMDISQPYRAGLTKVGYSPETMLAILRDRARYVIERGATLNNPHVPKSFFAGWEQIKDNHAARLRELVAQWISDHEQTAHVPLQPPHDRP